MCVTVTNSAGTRKRSTSMHPQSPTVPPAPDRHAKRALLLAYLIVLLDMAGLSIVIPLYPSMLQHYLDVEGSQGLLGALIGVLDRVSAAMGGAGGHGHI